jgi:hypothetical protein
LNFISQVVRMSLAEALRSRLPWITAAAILAAFGVAQFLAQVSIIEAHEVQVAIVSALLRATAIFMVVTFCLTSLSREASDKVTELLISQPVPRWHYVAAKLCGYGAVSVALAAAFTLPVLALAPMGAVFAWGSALSAELLIMVSVSVFCAVSMNQVLPAFAATSAFYLLARSVETLRAIAHHPISDHPGWVDQAVRGCADAIAAFMPALDRLAQSRWLIESPPTGHELAVAGFQAVLYVGLIGMATTVDLYRRSY